MADKEKKETSARPIAAFSDATQTQCCYIFQQFGDRGYIKNL